MYRKLVVNFELPFNNEQADIIVMRGVYVSKI